MKFASCQIMGCSESVAQEPSGKGSANDFVENAKHSVMVERLLARIVFILAKKSAIA